jgi:hypothetical protein
VTRLCWLAPPPSTSGPGHSPFKAVARVRIPLGAFRPAWLCGNRMVRWVRCAVDARNAHAVPTPVPTSEIAEHGNSRTISHRGDRLAAEGNLGHGRRQHDALAAAAVHRLDETPHISLGQLRSHVLRPAADEYAHASPRRDRAAGQPAARRAFPPQICAKIHNRNAELVALTASDWPSSRQLLLSR